MIIVAGTASAKAFLVKPALDDIFLKKDIQMLKWLPLALIIVSILSGLAHFCHTYLMSYVGQSIIKGLRNSLYDKIQDLPLSFFQKEKTGALMSRITIDVSVIRTVLSSAVTGALRDCFTIIGLTFVIFYRDWKMALIALVVLPLAFFPVVEFGRRVRRISLKAQEAMAELNSFLHETFVGNKIVKAFGMESFEKNRFFDMTQRLLKVEMKVIIVKSLSSPIMEFLLGGLGMGAILWYGGYNVITGKSTPGTFFSFMAAVIMLYGPFKKLSKLNNSVQQGLAAADRVFEILERESDIREHPNPVQIMPGHHQVNFRNVYFRYDQEMVLKNINLDVRAGEILAIVGESGGGKTSLVNLIPRFYDVCQGAVLVDGLDITKASIRSLRDQIAIVTQDPILFNDTIRNNIAYGNRAATDEDIEKAARDAYAYDFIQNCPAKFETNIGELGGRLSGGEKQRICIARALLKDAPILILDEATSSLDTESEMLVQKALENLIKGRTTFIIAHRLSTIGYAHRIIALADGQIVEAGNHHELLALKGVYYRLYQMQFNNGNMEARNQTSVVV
jgi:subfamily B ATP-binding cassette protein MsbA